MVIFLDTSAAYALADANDVNHGKAVRAFARALDPENALLTHSYVLVESVALLSRRLGWLPALRFLQQVEAFRIRWVDETLHRAAAKRFAQRKGRVSLVYEVSFLVMREAGARHALCFDADFAREGFLPYPG